MLRMLGFVALAVVVLHVLASPTQSPLTSDDTGAQWTTFPRPITRVAVIGAGPAGLQAAAHLLASGFSVRLFERAPSPGGNWFYTEATPVRESYPDNDNPKIFPDHFPATYYYSEGDDGISLDERWREHWQPRPVWHDLVTNGPPAATELPGVKYPANTPWTIPVHDVQRLVRSYASLHGLNTNDPPRPPSTSAITSYATRVERVIKCNATSTWRLTLRRLQFLAESNRIQEDFWEEKFDAVVVATGMHTTPHVPTIEGIEDWSKAMLKGEWSMYHSQSYRHPERYSGKTVLIVGASVSATDIARRISPVVHRLIVSIRQNPIRDAYGLDILLSWPANAELVPEIAAFQLLSRHDAGINDGRIRLANGTVLQGVDEVLLATGYRANTFLPELVNPATMNNLHWTGHYIHDPTLAFATAAPWTYGRYQSTAFAKVWAGTARLPSRARMWEDYISGKYQFGGAVDIFAQQAMGRQYVAWLNSESLELGGQFVEPLPVEDREVYVYFLSEHYKKNWFTHENFTRFDELPASEWPKPGPGGNYRTNVDW
ncbi:FAD/NAD-P-binding domain-containing protein [Mycena latifolia]|nr:FAD/NAD-P-binding domain-containing protein [Mycena latifolia]